MAEKITLEYDRIGDILHIEKVSPYLGQESDEIADDVIARYNPETGELESLEILFFFKRLSQDKVLELPIDAFKLAV